MTLDELCDEYSTTILMARHKRYGWGQDNHTEALLGLSCEVGEIQDHFKKALFIGSDFVDPAPVHDELGDLLYYLVAMCNLTGTNLRDIMELNLEKIKAKESKG